jgi:hypothetical protein
MGDSLLLGSSWKIVEVSRIFGYFIPWLSFRINFDKNGLGYILVFSPELVWWRLPEAGVNDI